MKKLLFTALSFTYAAPLYASEYNITPDLEGRWQVFLDWYMMFLYLFGGKGNPF